MELSSLDSNVLNTLSKIKYEEEKREEKEKRERNRLAGGKGKSSYVSRREAEMMEDALTGNL